jgi:hypothetical protein
VLVVHRRGGKTTAVINDIVKRALQCTKEAPRYAYIAPTYSQAKDVAWSMLKKAVSQIEGTTVSEGELWVTLPNGSRIRLYGADNYDRLRGIYLDGVAIDESADMAPEAWTEVIMPALADRDGWVVWIGTPKGKDAFYDVWRKAQEERATYFSLMLPASKSGILSPDVLAQQRSAPGMTEAIYNQEFECSFDAPIPGAIYSACVNKARGEGRVSRDVMHYAGLPVYTAFDIGAPVNTKCWIFQTRLDKIVFLECMTGDENCATPAAWVKRLKDKTGYVYGGHFLPHDGAVVWLKSMQEAGMNGIVALPPDESTALQSMWGNINQAVTAFPQCYFRLPDCNEGIEALEAYHSKQENDGHTLRNVPIHNWASHASTAFGYAHQAIRLGLLVDRSAMPGRAFDPSKSKVLLAGYNGARPNYSYKTPVVRKVG